MTSDPTTPPADLPEGVDEAAVRSSERLGFVASHRGMKLDLAAPRPAP